MTRTGNHSLGYDLVETAKSFIMVLSEKYADVPKYQHKTALVLTATKLVRLVDGLLRNRNSTSQKGTDKLTCFWLHSKLL